MAHCYDDLKKETQEVERDREPKSVNAPNEPSESQEISARTLLEALAEPLGENLRHACVARN